MKKSKRLKLVALYRFCVTEAHTFKPEVQIPYTFKRIYNIDTEIYSVKSISSGYGGAQSIKGYNGIKINFLKSFHIWFINIYSIFFLIRNAKKIDILYMMHLKPSTIYGILYKFLNPKGKLYISTDFNSKVDKNWYVKPTTIFKTIIYKTLKLLIKKCDCISTETVLGKEKLENYMPEFKNKLIYMPTGFNDAYFSKEFPSIKSYKEKENIMITIGRIGTYQKNNEMLLKSLEKIEIKDRKIYIIGPIEKSFEKNIKIFFKKRPDLKDKVIFTGAIYNKNELFNYYNKAKIFCLTSRREGFPITFGEAIYFGNYLLLTDISGAEDMINKGNNGKIIKIGDYMGFRKEFQKIINNTNILRNKSEEIHALGIKNLSWSKLIEKPAKKMNLSRK